VNIIPWNGQTITQPGVYSGISLDDYHTKTDLFDGTIDIKEPAQEPDPRARRQPEGFLGQMEVQPRSYRRSPDCRAGLRQGRALPSARR
jgi:hypothetical protein